jgi:monoamine oxidase
MEEVTTLPGDVAYYFGGTQVDEAAVVDEFRAFVPAMRRDLRTLSKAPSADSHTPADRALDLVSLREYLLTRGAGTIARKAIEEAYLAEYGLETDRQSCLNFLLFIHADRRSKFQPFGVFSDERYHIIQGNQAVAEGLANRLTGRILSGMELRRVRKTPAGQIELQFRNGGIRTHDAVVLAIPFSVLRLVDLDATLGLPLSKRDAIQNLGYGNNAKMMVGFSRRTWRDTGSNGSSYSDLVNHQTTWETNPSRATDTRAVLTDYSGGDRGAALNQGSVQQQVQLFLGDLNAVFPGALLDATRVGGNVLAHLEHWPSNPLTRGSYTCYLPGQFTTIAGNEGKPVGNLLFAGEHANSFYEWQGFMEGALLSGLEAAAEILK